MAEIRINVRIDEEFEKDLNTVAAKTKLTVATIVREAVQEKLLLLKRTHPAYANEEALAIGE